ncbi:MAG: hypothetical protein QE284_00240 [Rhizobium sp.]|nr:hypothetical protein [Rhizobium sp.]
MINWLGDCWQMVSNWLRELGSAHVVDDGLGDADEAARRPARDRKLAPRRGY